MNTANQNPFGQNEENPFANDNNNRGNVKNYIFIGVLIMLAILAFYFISNDEGSLQPNAKNISKLKEDTEAQQNPKEVEVVDTLTSDLPYYLWAFAEGDRAAVWVFSFKSDGKTHLTIFNPVTKAVSYQAVYPDADCELKRIEISKCLADDVGVYKNKVWISADEKNALRAIDMHSGNVLYDNNKLAEKFGALADGIFDLRSFGFNSIEFHNKSGEKVAFYPYAEVMGLKNADFLDGKYVGSTKRLVVNDQPGKSNVYVADLKVNNVKGDFRADYSKCEDYKSSPGFYKREYNGVKKLTTTLINPIKVAENGEVAIFLHDKEFGNSDVRYAEAIDVNGNSLWKDSTEVYQLINFSNSFPIRYNPHYTGNVAVFFNPTKMTTRGIDFVSGKVLWSLDQNTIQQIIK